MLDGDEGLGQALRLSSRAVVGVCAAVLVAHGPVGGVTLDGVAGAAGAQLFHYTHRVEQTLFLTEVWEKGQSKHQCRSGAGVTLIQILF